MSRGSTLARVFGLTRSQAPFDRDAARPARRAAVAIDEAPAAPALAVAPDAPLPGAAAPGPEAAAAAATSEPGAASEPEAATGTAVATDPGAGAAGPEAAPARDVAAPNGLSAPDAAAPAAAHAVPALSQVTVVADATTVAADDLFPFEPLADAGLRSSITAQAIDAIEADIASLLASLDQVRMPSPLEGAGEDGDEEDGDEGVPPAADDDVEAATLLLLSELDRLWRADPAVGMRRGG